MLNSNRGPSDSEEVADFEMRYNPICGERSKHPTCRDAARRAPSASPAPHLLLPATQTGRRRHPDCGARRPKQTKRQRCVAAAAATSRIKGLRCRNADRTQTECVCRRRVPTEADEPAALRGCVDGGKQNQRLAGAQRRQDADGIRFPGSVELGRNKRCRVYRQPGPDPDGIVQGGLQKAHAGSLKCASIARYSPLRLRKASALGSPPSAQR